MLLPRSISLFQATSSISPFQSYTPLTKDVVQLANDFLKINSLRTVKIIVLTAKLSSL